MINMDYRWIVGLVVISFMCVAYSLYCILLDVARAWDYSGFLVVVVVGCLCAFTIKSLIKRG